MTERYFAGIEAGGTKFVCAVANAQAEIVKEAVFPTREPKTTLADVVAFFQACSQEFPLEAMGVGCFGPINLNAASPTYGYVEATPKLAWRHFPILQHLQEAFSFPVGLYTDVDVAALGEYEWGAGNGLKNFVYMTVGTGIGACAFVNGQPLSGLVHAEMGHMMVPQDLARDSFPGMCPYHGGCLEGLACGEAMKQRWQVGSASQLAVDHEAWALQADYLAAALCNLIWVLSPERIILGGGVMKQMHLFAMIQERVKTNIAGYLVNTTLSEGIGEYIVPPGLGQRAGVMGAIALAMRQVAGSI
jgi:fructokinase